MAVANVVRWTEKDIRHLDEFYILRLPHGTKELVESGWPSVRMTAESHEERTGNAAMLLGPIYDGEGWVDLDIDSEIVVEGRCVRDPKGYAQVLKALEVVGLLPGTPHAIVESGGNHQGYRILVWLPVDVHMALPGGKHKLSGREVDIRARGYSLVAPSAVVTEYRWLKTPPPLSALKEWWSSNQQADELLDLWIEFARRLAPERHRREKLPDMHGTEHLKLLIEELTRHGLEPSKSQFDRRLNLIKGFAFEGDAPILGVKLKYCPNPKCRGSSERSSRSENALYKTWITPSCRLKCFHTNSCEVGDTDEGLPRQEWLPKYFGRVGRSLLTLLMRYQPEERKSELTFEQAKVETGRCLAGAIDDVEKDLKSIQIVDAPPGLMKTTMALWWAGSEATSTGSDPTKKESRIVLSPRHALVSEQVKLLHSIDKGEVKWRQDLDPLNVTDLKSKIVVLEGKARLCPLRARSSGDERRDSGGLPDCNRCGHKKGGCKYQEQWLEAAVPGRVLFGTHGIGKALMRRINTTSFIIFDELPDLFDTVSFDKREIRRMVEVAEPPAKAHIAPDIVNYCQARRTLGKALLALLDDVRSVVLERDEPYSSVVFGRTLRELPAFGKVSCGLVSLAAPPRTETVPGSSKRQIGKHRLSKLAIAADVRIDFDALLSPMRSLREGTESLGIGVLGVRCSADGRSLSVDILKPSGVFPKNVGCVVLAAGGELFCELVKALYPERNVRVQRIDVSDSTEVTRLALYVGSFAAKRRSAADRTRNAVAGVFLAILPDIYLWGLQNSRTSIAVGVACSQNVLTYLDHPNAAMQEVKELYREYGIVFESTGYYGNLHGSNQFRDVDVWVRLGDETPNISEMKWRSHALYTSGDSISARQLTLINQFHSEEQTRGRARPKERLSSNPLLDIKVGRFIHGYTDVRRHRGRPREARVVILELAIIEHMSKIEWCSANLLADLLLGADGPGPEALRHYWTTRPCACVVLKEPTYDAASEKYFRDTLGRLLRSNAEKRGWTTRTVKAPWHSGIQHIWESRKGAYDKWVKQYFPEVPVSK
jgi:hypothetical protein